MSKTGVFFLLVWISSGLVSVGQPLQEDRKNRLSPFLHDGENSLKNEDKIRAIISNFELFSKWSSECAVDFEILKKIGDSDIIIEVMIDKEGVAQLEGFSWVKYIDYPKRKPVEELSFYHFDPLFNSMAQIRGFYDFAGQGLTVSIKENPFDKDHIDFKGRVANAENHPSQFSFHATEMAQIIAGGGNLSPSLRGVAWRSKLLSSSFEDLFPDDNNFLKEHNVSVQNHSYGVGIENYYGIESLVYDLQCIENPSLFHVFSSGNEGQSTPSLGEYGGIGMFANLTGQFKTSKNTLCVGASDIFGTLDARSSRGPASDGRVKPEIIAYGPNGSSDAAALVSGISLILQEAYKSKFDQLPESSLLKAVLINSAQNLNGELTFGSGYGNINGQNSLKTIVDRHFFEGEVLNNEVITFKINVTEKAKKLNVTVVWCDPIGEINGTKALVNDIDLSLKHIGNNEVWLPWVLNSDAHIDSLSKKAIRKKDTLNNVEKISVFKPEPGIYEIMLEGSNVGSDPQRFSIAYEILEDDAWIYPAGNNTISSLTQHILRWNVLEDKQISGKLEWIDLNDKEGDWKIISESVDIKNGFFIWDPPVANTFVKLRITSEELVLESPIFGISDFQNLNVAYYCEGETFISWPFIPEADYYTVYELGDQYLEPIQISYNNFYEMNDVGPSGKYISVAPVVDGNELFRTNSILIDDKIGCYFTRFSTDKLVSDKAVLNIEISTSYNIDSILIERSTDSKAFEALGCIKDVETLEFEYVDDAPFKGLNVYRAKILTKDKKRFFSDLDHVYYLEKREAVLFPNPVSAGKILNLAVNDDDLLFIQIINLNGQIILEFEHDGQLRPIDTAILKRGVYIARVMGEGYVFSEKFVVL